MSPGPRVAALYDIHANLPALEAVLRDVREAGIDNIVVGGDVVPGPMPHETLACLLDLDLPAQFIRGNGEREILAQLAGSETSTVPERFRPLLRWVAGQLAPEHVRTMAGWPPALQLEIDGLGLVLFCHASPRSDTDIFTRQTPAPRLLPLFAGLEAAVVVCGHTHMQFDRQVGGVRVINAGSVGSPYGEPGAYWLELGPQVRLRHTRYDLPQAAARIRATAYPGAADSAERDVLHPPVEADMLAAFSRAESV